MLRRILFLFTVPAMADVSYTANLQDTTNNVSTSLTASRTFFSFKK